MMNRIIQFTLLVVALGFSFNDVKAQTKEETAAWLEKQAWQAMGQQRLWVNDGVLYITKLMLHDNLISTVSIPLDMIKEIKIDVTTYKDDHFIDFITYFGNKVIKNRTFQHVSYEDGLAFESNKKEMQTKIVKNGSSGIDSYHDSFGLTITNMNEELQKRLQKAFNHLAKLHGGCDPNKKNPEIF